MAGFGEQPNLERHVGQGNYRAKNAAMARSAESDFVKNASTEQLRMKIAECEAAIQARQASIERLVVQMQEGERNAQGKNRLMKINELLQAEAQGRKLQLLSEAKALTEEKLRAEEELARL